MNRNTGVSEQSLEIWDSNSILAHLIDNSDNYISILSLSGLSAAYCDYYISLPDEYFSEPDKLLKQTITFLDVALSTLLELDSYKDLREKYSLEDIYKESKKNFIDSKFYLYLHSNLVTESDIQEDTIVDYATYSTFMKTNLPNFTQ